MRRVVHDYVAVALRRAKPDLQEYIAEHLCYFESFPYALSDPMASIQEIHDLRVTPRFRADYPPVDITVTMRISMTANTRFRETGTRFAVDATPGRRTFALDVALQALGTARGDGYELAPIEARLTAWWGFDADRRVRPIS